MDLEKYRVLIQVIEAGSISQAADSCSYTISGISRMINTLEKEQGFPLLHRQHGGVIPTKECELLLPHLKELLFQEKIIKQISEDIRGAKSGTISIGIAYSSYYPWIAKQTEQFRQTYPNVYFDFMDGYSSDLLEKLKLHQLDLCLISEREGMDAWIPLGEEELVAWFPINHPLAKEPFVTLSVLETEPYIDIYPGKDTDNNRTLAKNNIKPNTIMSAGDSFSAYSMVEAGLGISMNHRSNCQKWTGDVATVPIKPYIAIPVGLTTTKLRSPLVEAFWKFCRQ